jgi:hypothetical protein
MSTGDHHSASQPLHIAIESKTGNRSLLLQFCRHLQFTFLLNLFIIIIAIQRIICHV